MAGQASAFDFDDDEIKKITRPKLPERIEAVKDASIPTIDLNDLEGGQVIQADPPTKAAAPNRVEGEWTPPPMKASAIPQGPTADKTAAPAGGAPGRPRETTFFSSSVATPVEIDRTLVDQYGTEWLEWQPETLFQTIRMDFNTQISKVNQDKILAVQLLHVSDSFWRHWEAHEKVVLAFNNLIPMFDRVQDVTMGQLFHAVHQAHQIRRENFQDEVKGYMAAHAKAEGMIWLPPPLDVVQDALDALLPHEIRPLTKEIRERWDAFEDLDLKNIEFQEDVFGVQLARLAAIDSYLVSMSTPEVPEKL